MKKQLAWRVGHTADPHQSPLEFVPATVPGAVQLDWARAKGWPQPEYDSDLSKYAWMEDVYWVYRAELAKELEVESNQSQRVFFVCKGVDYQCEVRLNGQKVHAQEGMYRGIELDLTDKAKTGDVLEVLVFPAPKSCVTPVDRNQANQSVKPAVSYGWDFHPRLVPLGIWDEIYLETRPGAHFDTAEVRYSLAADLSRADMRLQLSLYEKTADVTCSWRVLDPDGQIVHTQTAEIKDHLQLNATL